MSNENDFPADRVLDVKVARVLGWQGDEHWVDDADGCDPYLFEPDADPEAVRLGDHDWDCIVPWFSTVLDHALDALSSAKARGLRVTVTPGGATPAEAICHAILIAAGAAGEGRDG